ncbi:MAG TPA: DUF47 family protein [Planctomycetota bacterium]|nr:DUF47 family protein [Planctomycetota bacterium]
MKTIGGIFGRSPYGPVHEMMLKVEQCVGQVPAMVAAFVAGDRVALEAVTRQIDTLEGQADDIKREIRKHLSTSLFSSVERTEILDLVHSLDEIADAAQDAGKLMGMRCTPVPVELAPSFGQLAARVTRGAAELTAVTARLSGNGGPGGGSVDIHELIAALEGVARIEFECDEQQHDMLKRLLAMEDRLGPMDIFFLMNIIKELGEIADELENAADGLARVLGSR